MTAEKDLFYIKQILSGKVNDYAMLVNKYKDMVFTLSLSLLQQKEEAEDVSQDIFVKVFKSLHKFQNRSKFSTWLYRIAYNECISRLRKKKEKLVSIQEIENSCLTEIQNSEDNWKYKENRRNELKKALQKLPEPDRTIILLHYYEALSIEEIALITALTKSNVKIRLFRTRKKLHDMLINTFETEIIND